MLRTCNSRFWRIVGLSLLLTACASAPEPAPQGGGAPAELPREYQQALQMMQEGRYEDAIPALEKLTRSHSGAAGPYTNLGIAYSRTGNSTAAVAALEQAVRNNPASAAAHNQLGMSYREAGRFADARKAYESALAADSSYVLAHRNLGILLDVYLQMPAEALPHYEAYAQAQGGEDKEISLWIAELKQRIGSGP